MLQDRGRQRDIVRVLDFGIAKLRDDSRATQQAMTQAGDMLGTPQYMAPEQIRGEAIDGRTDVYALGCMIYEMVTARLPYEAATIMGMLSKHLTEQAVAPSARRPELGLPPAIDQIVLAAMAKDPNARPPTMDQYFEMLAGVLQRNCPRLDRRIALAAQHAEHPDAGARARSRPPPIDAAGTCTVAGNHADSADLARATAVLTVLAVHAWRVRASAVGAAFQRKSVRPRDPHGDRSRRRATISSCSS